MALQMTAWKMSGKSDIEIKHTRLKNKSEISRALQDADTQLVTIERTDKQSNIIHEIWQSDKYVSLDLR